MPFPLLGLLGGAAISGASNVIGGAMANSANAANVAASNQANRDIARDTNEWNRAMAHEQFAFQERMSSTAYQRATEDMRKAGVNPMLAIGQGGASSPAGVAFNAVTGAPNVAPEYKDPIGKGVNSAVDTARLINDLRQTDSSVALQGAQAMGALAQANNANASAKATEASMPSIKGKAKSADAEARAMIAKSGSSEASAEYDKKYAGFDAAVSRIIQMLGGAVDAVSIGRLIKGSQIMKERNQRERESHELKMFKGAPVK